MRPCECGICTLLECRSASGLVPLPQKQFNEASGLVIMPQKQFNEEFDDN